MHTPAPLARFMAQAVDGLLRRFLGRPAGLAAPGLLVVDPAVGVGAFPAAVAAVAPGRAGRLLGFDLDPAAVATARAVLTRVPAAQGPGRLDLRPGNALAVPPGGVRAPEEGAVVVLGNPPWAGRSASRGGPTDRLLDDFRRDAAGAPLRERKLGVLSDDYVRFLRWGAEVVRQAPAGGVLCLVTNGSFLDGPVHRGVRAALLRWFDGVDVVDLGGGSLVARAGTAGRERDESVFGVRPPAAITMAWTAGAGSPGRRGSAAAELRVARLRGSRAAKLAALGAGEIRWAPGDGAPPRCLFSARPAQGRRRALRRYQRWPRLDELMPFHREGLQTNRDAIATAPSRAALIARLEALVAGAVDPALCRGLRPAPHFDPAAARRAVADVLRDDPDGRRGRSALRMSYRPGEERWVVPVRPLCHRPRPALLRAMARHPGGGALVTVRKDRGDRPWAHVGWVPHPPDSSWLSSRSSCRTRAFPLADPDGRENLDPDRVAAWLGVGAGGVPPAADVVAVALAILWAPGYRRRFGDELRLDPPRLPSPPDRAAWAAAVALGDRLRAAFRRLAAGDDGGEERPAESGPVPAVVVGHRQVPSLGVAGLAEAADALVLPWLEAAGVARAPV